MNILRDDFGCIFTRGPIKGFTPGGAAHADAKRRYYEAQMRPCKPNAFLWSDMAS